MIAVVPGGIGMLDNKVLISIGGIMLLCPATPVLGLALIGTAAIGAGFYYLFRD